jgi:hypothetical protein
LKLCSGRDASSDPAPPFTLPVQRQTARQGKGMKAR